MDKQRRKEIKKELKRQQLIKDAESDNEQVASFAKIALGIPLESITIDDIKNNPTIETQNKILLRIEEYISKKKTENRKITEKEVVSQLSPDLQMLFYTNPFEGEISGDGFMGFFFNSYVFDVHEVLRSYQLIDCYNVNYLIEKGIGVFLRNKLFGDTSYSAVDKEFHEIIKKSQWIKYILKSLFWTFEKLDDKYYAIDNEVYETKMDYIRNNAENFIIK